MALLSSHTLNGLNGTHAGGISVTLTNLANGAVVFATEMDAGGRLSQEIPSEMIDPLATYELVFDTGSYWEEQGVCRTGEMAMTQVVLRFAMADPDGKYHMPVILSPNSYSMWTSA